MKIFSRGRTILALGLPLGGLPLADAGAAEPIVRDLWPGKAPSDTPISGEERSRIYSSTIVGPTKLITNVTRPSLTVYLPSKDTNTGTAMIICPGGGYHDLFWELEGEEVAAWLTSVGITGIILKYRVPERPGEDPHVAAPLGPRIDAQRAVSIVRSEASKWGIDPQRIGMVGFSAGGHLAVVTATNFATRLYEAIDDADRASCRPDFAIGCYSGYLKATNSDALWPGLSVSDRMPPVFLAHASDDKISPSDGSAIMYLALHRAGVPVELHLFATGNHDFGVRQNNNPPSAWTSLCLTWLRSLNLLVPAK